MKAGWFDCLKFEQCASSFLSPRFFSLSSLFFIIFSLGSLPPTSADSVGSIIKIFFIHKISPYHSTHSWLPTPSLMADVTAEEELRLPSEFLPDDLFLENEFDSFGSSSVLSSPVESTLSSSETESSDEDFLAALTQRLSETKIPSTPYFCQNQQEKKNWYVSGSPQSTLAGIGKYLYPITISGNGSTDGPFQFPSPPETPFGAEKDTWDSNTVSRTRSYPSRCTRTLPCLKSSYSGSYSDPRLCQYLPQSSPFQCRRYEQVSEEQCSLESRKMAAFAVLQQQRHRFDTRERYIMHENGRCEPPEALAYHPWRTQNQGKRPQHNRSILQPSINGGSAVKRESVGTGVFLPRNYANPTEQRKHTGIPTDRPVKVQEFSLSYKDTKERRRGPFDGNLVPNYAPKYGISTLQRHGYNRPDAALKHEQLLPLEWNY